PVDAVSLVSLGLAADPNRAFLGGWCMSHRFGPQDRYLGIGEAGGRKRRLVAGHRVKTVHFLAHVVLPALAGDLLILADELHFASAPSASGADHWAALAEVVPLDPEIEKVASRFLVRRSCCPANEKGVISADAWSGKIRETIKVRGHIAGVVHEDVP